MVEMHGLMELSAIAHGSGCILLLAFCILPLRHGRNTSSHHCVDCTDKQGHGVHPAISFAIYYLRVIGRLDDELFYESSDSIFNPVVNIEHSPRLFFSSSITQLYLAQSLIDRLMAEGNNWTCCMSC